MPSLAPGDAGDTGDIDRRSWAPTSHHPLGAKEATPDTVNSSLGECGGAQHGGEHWGQQAGTPKSFCSAPQIVAAKALGQTGPTGKVSQELI